MQYFHQTHVTFTPEEDSDLDWLPVKRQYALGEIIPDRLNITLHVDTKREIRRVHSVTVAGANRKKDGQPGQNHYIESFGGFRGERMPEWIEKAVELAWTKAAV